MTPFQVTQTQDLPHRARTCWSLAAIAALSGPASALRLLAGATAMLIYAFGRRSHAVRW